MSDAQGGGADRPFFRTLRRAFADRGKAGSLGAALLLITATPRPALFSAAIAVSVVGVLWRLWASGCVRKNQEIARRGPYAIVRHPLYLGNGILWVGFLLANGNLWFAVASVLFFLHYHIREIRYEEGLLLSRFPDDYAAYIRDVAMIIPGPMGLLRLPRQVAAGGFSLALALHHHEHRVVLATPLLLALLWEFQREGRPVLWRWVASACFLLFVLGRLLVVSRRLAREAEAARAR